MNNIGDAKNLLAVAKSGLGRVNGILIQMRNKAEQGASDTMGQAERQVLIDQMSAYSKQIDDVVAQTKWASGTGAKSLIGGEYDATALTFQTGVDSGETTTLDGLQNMTASAANNMRSCQHFSSFHRNCYRNRQHCCSRCCIQPKSYSIIIGYLPGLCDI